MTCAAAAAVVVVAAAAAAGRCLGRLGQGGDGARLSDAGQNRLCLSHDSAQLPLSNTAPVPLTPLQQAQRASPDDGGAYDEDGNDDCDNRDGNNSNHGDNRDGNNSNDDDNNNEDDKAQQSYLPKLLNINRNILQLPLLPFSHRVAPREVTAARKTRHTSHLTPHTSHLTNQTSHVISHTS